jgi:hypothetical protein
MSACRPECPIFTGAYCTCGGLQARMGVPRDADVWSIDARGWLRYGGDVLVVNSGGAVVGRYSTLEEATHAADQHNRGLKGGVS